MRNLRLLVACTAIFALLFAVSCGDDNATAETNCTDGVDNDGDGPIDCNDSDCDNDQACQTVCNNNDLCEPAAGETATNCPADCATNPCNNDGNCDAGENETNCPADCAVNPCNNDGNCDAGETTANCPADCGGGQCLADSDVLADNGCGTGETCDLAQTGAACRTTGSVANYAVCAAPTDCGANAICISVDGGVTNQCLPYCDIQTTTPPAACPGAGVCAGSIQDHSSLGLCLEQSNACDPVDNNGCTSPEMCFFFASGADCAAPTANPAAVGAACDQGSGSGCVEGASCFSDGTNSLCYEVCNLSDSSGCAAGTCQGAIGSTTYGICQ